MPAWNPCHRLARRARFVAVTALVACTGVTPAVAEDRDEEGIPADATAADLVREGVRLRRAHRNEEALDAFRRAYERAPSSATRAQIAFAEQALGRFTDAEHDLVLSLAEQDEWVGRHRPQLEEALRALQGHLAWLRIEVNVEAEIVLDGAHVDPGKEVRTAAGPHRVVVRGAGGEQARDVEVAPREHARAIFLLEPPRADAAPPAHGASASTIAPTADSTAPATPAAPVAAPPSRPSRVGPLVLGGVGLSGIVIGAAFGIDAIAAKNERQNHCNADNTCDPAGLAADSRLRSSSTVSTVAFALGAACSTAAVVWWILDGKRAPVSAGLGGSAGLVGATVAGRF